MQTIMSGLMDVFLLDGLIINEFMSTARLTALPEKIVRAGGHKAVNSIAFRCMNAPMECKDVLACISASCEAKTACD